MVMFFTKASHVEDLFAYFFTSKPITVARSATCQRKPHFLTKHVTLKPFPFVFFKMTLLPIMRNTYRVVYNTSLLKDMQLRKPCKQFSAVT